MHKKISVTELRRRLRSVVDEVANTGEAYVFTRRNRPAAALVRYWDYLRFQRLEESKVLVQFDRAWARLAELNAGVSAKEIAEEIIRPRMG
jgi:prevent-host-death family protein